jgi:hypothetical protein
MTIPMLLYACETWILKRRDLNRILAAEMKYLRTVKGFLKVDQVRNENILNDLDFSPLYENITEYRDKCKIHLHTISLQTPSFR